MVPLNGNRPKRSPEVLESLVETIALKVAWCSDELTELGPIIKQTSEDVAEIKTLLKRLLRRKAPRRTAR